MGYFKNKFKIFIILGIFLLVLNFIALFVSHNKGLTFKTEEGSFTYETISGYRYIFSDMEGNDVVIIQHLPNSAGKLVPPYTIEYLNRTIQVTLEDNSFFIEQSDGNIYRDNEETSNRISFVRPLMDKTEEEVRTLHKDVQMVYGIQKVVAYANNVQWEDILTLLGLSVLGSLLLVLPHVAWKIDHFLWVEGGKPSELYIAIQVIAGGAMCLASFIISMVKIFN